jgi:hypothetical protein
MVARRNARPGVEVAGFSTTSCPRYAGFVRSSRVAGTADFLPANAFLS